MLKLILQSIRKRKKKLILIVIQFIIGFCALLFSLCTIENLLQYRKNIEKLAPLDSYHIFINNDKIEEFNYKTIEKYEKIVNEIKTNHLVEKMGIFERVYLYTVEKNPIEIPTTVIMANSDLLNMAQFQLNSGSYEDLLKYKTTDTIVPVLVSSSLQDTYCLGQEYEFSLYDENYDMKNIRFKVAGVLDSSMCFWDGGGSSITENVAENKEFIICPMFSKISTDIAYMTNTIIELKKQGSNDDVLNKISEIYSNYELSPEFNTLEDEINEYYTRQKVVVMATMIFAVIILLLSILGCIGTVLSSIISRNKEFGIYFSLGLTKKNLIYLVCGEIVILFLFSFFVGSIVSVIMVNIVMATEGFVINLHILCSAFMIMFICAMLCVIIPLKKVTTLNPIDLLSGRDN